ncbi:MAG: 2-oxoglutarate dehydrogenase E1 component [Bacteroidia bacterium]|nr:2-oxoglutarate dehydrogenase E1 component [Bacteroidia bacterium]
MPSFDYLSNTTPEFIEQLYRSYRENPDSVTPDWKRFFEGFEFARTSFEGEEAETPSTGVSMSSGEFNVINLINGYRQRGHLFADTNPVMPRRKYAPGLEIQQFGLSDADLEVSFYAGEELGLGKAKLKDIVTMLQETYCGHIGAEYMYVREPEMLNWLKSIMEKSRNIPRFDVEKRKRILGKLIQGVAFEGFLHTKFVGQKRFSLEGAEALIPALDAVIEKGASLGVDEFIIGMAHRGRLNVLANILHKEYDEIFGEFEGLESGGKVVIDGMMVTEFAGDVKYHMGYSSNIATANGKEVHLSLMPNPSHLETVSAVLEGVARAKIDRKYKDFSKLAPILIHGDAAVAGQGIVYEVIQMSLLEGYKTGGTIHLIINNQVGFTTGYHDARSSTYCTDIAKTTLSPVFHVNGDDSEALVYAIELAVEFRQKFQRDVFIDILCYRLRGHNEGDEPSFTQPLLYKAIKGHPNPAQVYIENLKKSGEAEVAEMAKQMEKEFKSLLQSELEEATHKKSVEGMPYLKGVWDGIRRVKPEDFMGGIVPTGVEKKKLLELVEKIHQIPEGFNANPKLRKLFDERMKMAKENRFDWALGELLAYATLLTEGFPIRLSGQDVKRGTFSHRHAAIFAEDTEQEYIPLNHIQDEQAKFQVFNSLLSEYGVLGFEYGYSLGHPNQLVIWEAQFGDFANGAQIIMDQYISSAETKWQRMSGLVQLLPHGYEGQGPEHSSARIERYLELCASKNMQICNITTPANYFHVLRRQLHREFRIPLVVFSPKKLLRFPACVSPVEDFVQGGFMEVIDDSFAIPEKVTRILFCSGKIYYDLLEQQQKENRTDVAIVRLEQLYPLPINQLREVVAKYPNASYHWVQEEPRNMGPWSYILRMLSEIKIEPICRKPSSSPATGFPKQHIAQQQYIVNSAFGLITEKVK